MKKWEIIGLAVLCCSMVLNIMVLREVKGIYVPCYYDELKTIESEVSNIYSVKSDVDSIKSGIGIGGRFGYDSQNTLQDAVKRIRQPGLL